MPSQQELEHLRKLHLLYKKGGKKALMEYLERLNAAGKQQTAKPEPK